ncbi:hypothetical protein [Candidatus Thiodiazotropha sp. CDECU1]|uniref:hypothetical protein n=1 Tax=Candidatus Thiodiazotropha sp. CDECU1 TaxID=3065865 RepID=UPI00292E0B06|nr:hypothetical protein [Candidatus Thiodiazotropha sp. CDECU1]
MFKILGMTFIFYGLYVLFTGIDAFAKGYGLLILIQASVASFVVLFVGWWFVSIHDEHMMYLKHKRVQALVESKTQAIPSNLVMYLRPFDSTNKYFINTEWMNMFSEVGFSYDASDDIEMLISKSLQRKYEFVALGKPGEHRGAGRILVDENEWKAQVERLSIGSLFILIIPSYKEGTLWEIEMIINNDLLYKTIFIIPPLDGVFYTFKSNVEYLSRKKTQQACEELGLRLPMTEQVGGIYKVAKKNGQDKLIIKKFPKISIKQWRNTIIEISND